MKSSSTKLWILAAILTCSGTVLAQSRFIWTDENGRKVYSDNPPPASLPRARILKGGELIGKSGLPASDTSEAAKSGDAKAKAPMTLAERDAESKKQAKATADKNKLSDEKDAADRQRAGQCAEQRTYLTGLESGARISRQSASGEREFLDDAQRAAEVSKIKALLERECK